MCSILSLPLTDPIYTLFTIPLSPWPNLDDSCSQSSRFNSDAIYNTCTPGTIQAVLQYLRTGWLNLGALHCTFSPSDSIYALFFIHVARSKCHPTGSGSERRTLAGSAVTGASGTCGNCPSRPCDSSNQQGTPCWWRNKNKTHISWAVIHITRANI